MKNLHRMHRLNRVLRTCLLGLLGPIALGAALPAAAVEDAGYRSVFARGAGGRPLALGGAYVAADGDLSSAIWNPAGLAGIQRKGAYATHTDLIGMGFSEQFAVVALPSWRLGTFSLALRRFAVDGIEGRDHGGAITDTDLQDAETEFALGYGRSFGPAWRLGANLKLQQQELAGYGATGVGIDLGAQVHPLLAAGRTSNLARGWSLGVQLRNVVEPNLRLLEDDSPDPAGVRLGTALGMPLGDHLDALGVLDLEKTKSMDARLHAGVEIRLMELLALRAGSFDGMLTAGTGLAWRQFQLDYSFEDNPIETVHRMGLGISFGKTADEQRQAVLQRQEEQLQERLARAFATQRQKRVAALLGELRAALDDDDAETALGLVSTLRVLDPASKSLDALESQAYCVLALHQEQQDNLTGATLNFGRAAALDGGNERARLGLDRVRRESGLRHARSEAIRSLFDEAMTAFTAGRLVEARSGFENVLSQAPGDPEAATMLEQVRQTLRIRAESLADRAIGQAESGRLPAARESLVEARRLDADCPSIAVAQRSIENRERRDRETAAARERTAARNAAATATTAAAQPIVVAQPTFEGLSPDRQREIAELYRSGMTEAQNGRRDNALRYWEMVWAEAPDYQQVTEHLKGEYLARGMEAFAAGDLERAIGHWERTLLVDPDDPRAKGYLARAQEQRTRIREIRSTQR